VYSQPGGANSSTLLSLAPLGLPASHRALHPALAIANACIAIYRHAYSPSEYPRISFTFRWTYASADQDEAVIFLALPGLMMTQPASAIVCTKRLRDHTMSKHISRVCPYGRAILEGGAFGNIRRSSEVGVEAPGKLLAKKRLHIVGQIRQINPVQMKHQYSRKWY